MSRIPGAMATAVRKRARDACEYCRLSQASQEAIFHIDHIKPRVARGPTTLANLALACVSCSLRKAARTHATDPLTGEIVPLFHPRRQTWADHFARARRWKLVGITSTGRATIEALRLNRKRLVDLRKTLAKLSRLVAES